MPASDRRVDPGSLSLRTRVALLELKRALAKEGFIEHAQVTFDSVAAADIPPTVDVIQVRRNLKLVDG